MTIGRIEFSGQSYMRTYVAEMLLRADNLHTLEKVAGPLPTLWPMRVVSLLDAQLELSLTEKRGA